MENTALNTSPPILTSILMALRLSSFPARLTLNERSTFFSKTCSSPVLRFLSLNATHFHRPVQNIRHLGNPAKMSSHRYLFWQQKEISSAKINRFHLSDNRQMSFSTTTSSVVLTLCTTAGTITCLDWHAETVNNTINKHNFRI